MTDEQKPADNSARKVNFLIGTAIGLISGWVVGYWVVVSRIEESDNSLTKVVVYNMAPTAPDTILCMVLGGLIGGLIGWNMRGGDK